MSQFLETIQLLDGDFKRLEFHQSRMDKALTHFSPFKMADRTDYQNVFSKRDNCDDVLLVKNGLLTDTSYCNIALFDGVQWFTPKTPLIQGVNRAQLLADGRLLAKDIKLDELLNFQRISLFNALNEFGTIEIEIS